MNVYDLTQA